MRRLITLLLLVFFASTQTSPSMFMLSIEKGRVYTEGYNLCHIIKATYSSPASNPDKLHPVYGSGQHLRHSHVQLTRYTIPENPTASGIAAMFSSIDIFAVHPVFSVSRKISPFPKQLFFSWRLKLPITTLLQSSILLI